MCVLGGGGVGCWGGVLGVGWGMVGGGMGDGVVDGWWWWWCVCVGGGGGGGGGGGINLWLKSKMWLTLETANCVDSPVAALTNMD